MPGSHGIAWSLKVYLTETQVCNLQFTLHYYNSVHSVCVCKSLFPLVYGCIVGGVRWCGWLGWCRLPGPLIFIGFHQRHLASPSHQPRPGDVLSLVTATHSDQLIPSQLQAFTRPWLTPHIDCFYI